MSQVPVAPIVAPEQRGHTWVGEVRKTSVRRFTIALTAPVAGSAVPPVIFGEPKRFTRQVGTPAAKSGIGGPNVGPFACSVAVSFSVHADVVVASQAPRHIRSSVPKTTGKLCESPL